MPTQSPRGAEYESHKPAGQTDGLEKIIAAKVDTLAGILDDVARDINTRRDLGRQTRLAILKHYCAVSSELANLMDLHVLSVLPTDAARRRHALLAQLDTLRAEERREIIRSWEDVARLKAEFRTWLKQFAHASLRAGLVSPYASLPSVEDLLRSIEE